MAVIDDMPGVEVTVQLDGVALNEYEDKSEEDPDKTITRYIEAVRGKEFKVQVEIKKGFKLECDALSFQVYADGTLAQRRFFKAKEAKLGSTIQVKGFSDRINTTKFRFDELETVTDGRQMKKEAVRLENLGTLKVVLHRSQVNGQKAASKRQQPPAIGIVSEKALKGRALSHRVGTSRVGDKVTIRFRYHSLEALKSQLIVPHTPSPPPLEDKDPADFTPEYIKELQRRAKEAQAQEDTKRKVKRERIDDNSRPRKISRPGNGSTQLELGDDGSFQEASVATLGREELEVIELN